MPRSNVPYLTNLPYHITARTINRDWFSMPMHEVWTIMEDQLCLMSWGFGTRIYSFVLMANHFHMIAEFPKDNMSASMEYFMRESSRAILRDSNRINRTWGSRYHRCLLGSNHYFMSAYKYVYQNPLQVGSAERVELYPFSTLSGLLGLRPLRIPVVEDRILDDSLEDRIEWLNTRIQDRDWDAIRKSLKKSSFDLPKLKCKPHPLEIDLP